MISLGFIGPWQWILIMIIPLTITHIIAFFIGRRSGYYKGKNEVLENRNSKN